MHILLKVDKAWIHPLWQVRKKRKATLRVNILYKRKTNLLTIPGIFPDVDIIFADLTFRNFSVSLVGHKHSCLLWLHFPFIYVVRIPCTAAWRFYVNSFPFRDPYHLSDEYWKKIVFGHFKMSELTLYKLHIESAFPLPLTFSLYEFWNAFVMHRITLLTPDSRLTKYPLPKEIKLRATMANTNLETMAGCLNNN